MRVQLAAGFLTVVLSGCGTETPMVVSIPAATPPAPAPAPPPPSEAVPPGQPWEGKTYSQKTYRFIVPEGWRIDSPRAIGADFYSPGDTLYFGTRNDEPLGWTGLGYKVAGTETIVAVSGLSFAVTYTEPDTEAWAKLGYQGYDDNPNAIPVVATGTDASGTFELRVIFSYDAVKDPEGKAKLPELLNRIRIP